MTHINEQLVRTIKQGIGAKKYLVKKPAKGALKYDYIVPGGHYQEQWDWDGFFMGVGLASEIASEAIFLRNWALNYITLSDKNGYSPGCVTPEGTEKGHRAFLMKPFIAQGAYLAGKFLNDFSWIKPYYQKLKTMVLYREKHLWNKKLDLGVWYEWVESGADNNPSIFELPKGKIVACDVNTFIYRNYKAMSLIAKKLGRVKDETYFSERAKTIKNNINKYLWDEKDQTFYNFNSQSGDFVRRVSYSNLVPLWEKIAPEEKGRIMIKKYVLNPQKLWAKHGIRTLALDDPLYNQKIMITPHSNWQGPIWPICNYIYLHGLLNYGFQKEAVQLARKITLLCLNDLKTSGGMHECYNAETGKGLAGPNFVSWNLLVSNMLEEAINHRNPFEI